MLTSHSSSCNRCDHHLVCSLCSHPGCLGSALHDAVDGRCRLRLAFTFSCWPVKVGLHLVDVISCLELVLMSIVKHTDTLTAPLRCLTHSALVTSQWTHGTAPALRRNSLNLTVCQACLCGYWWWVAALLHTQLSSNVSYSNRPSKCASMKRSPVLAASGRFS